MTYREAVEYISNIPKFTTKNKPEHTKLFLKYLGSPQQKFQTIHVAGTNGKGSVCVYLSAMLAAQGKSVGMFTSPHLVTMNERIVINGKMISNDSFLLIFETVLKAVREMEKDALPHPTFFEFLFGMAVTAFGEANVEYAVMETGLGGRLDATNSIEHPVCSVIASIGMDHTEILGDTLEKIAAEKAGIIKPGVPVFYLDGDEASNRVIEKTAAKCGSFRKKIGKDAFEILGIEHKHIAFSCVNAYYGNTAWTLHNTGIYQPENAMLAMEVMRKLFGTEGKTNLWRHALADVVWEGRMEEIAPDIFVDGAHNPDAVLRFVESVKANGGEHVKTAVLFSAVQDKDYEEMIACLCGNLKADFYVVTHISDKRAEDTEKLAEKFRRYTENPVIVRETLESAWKYLCENQGGRTVYCLGSLYLVGMLKEMLKEES